MKTICILKYYNLKNIIIIYLSIYLLLYYFVNYLNWDLHKYVSSKAHFNKLAANEVSNNKSKVLIQSRMIHTFSLLLYK